MREGTILCDRFRIDQSLGRGGMSDVYLAFDQRRRAHVAVKVLREDLAEDPDFVRRFAREADALARLDHPNIVRFYSFEQEGALAFIVMDYVPGSTLARRLRETAGPLPAEEVTHVLRQVGSALQYAHREGYIHRDIKPGNIMLREDGTVLLADFGIARAAESATMTMGPAGTPAYMSPEQIKGQELTPRADVYSLGVVLFEMATGQRPFSGDEGTGTSRIERVRDAHLQVEPPDPQRINPQLSRAVAAVILRALAKSADRRFQDVTSLVQAWEDALGLTHEPSANGRALGGAVAIARTKTERPARAPSSPVVLPAAGAHPQESQGRPRRGLWVAIAAVVLLGAAAALFLLVFQPDTGKQPDAVAQRSTPAVAATVAAATATATPLISTPDIGATAQVLAGQIATQTVEAQGTMDAIVAERVAGTATASAGTATVVAETTASALAAEIATAESATHATETAIARATEEVLARDATSTAVAQATAEVIASATRAAQATAQAKAAAATTAKAATAIAVSKQRPGLIFDFERDYAWKRGDQPYGQIARSAEQVKAGNSSDRFQYDFPGVAGNFVVFVAKPALPIPGQATGITAWVYGDGAGHFLNTWVQDAAGEIRAYTFGQIKHQGWQQVTAWLDDTRGWPNGHISGPDDGRISYPASLYALILDGVPDGQASRGVIYLDELISTQEAMPKSEPTPQPGPAYVPPAANAAPAPAAASGLRFQLANGGACAPNAGTSYYDGVVQHRDGSPYNGVCVHTAFNGPRNTKCTGCGIGAGKWSFSPFGGAAPSGISVQVYVVNCPSRGLGDGGINENFGDLAPLSDVWTHTFNQSEQCTGITFIGD